MVKEKLFELFGSYLQLYDSNKELDPSNQNRGTLQRYQEMLGGEIDTYLIPKISNLLINTYPNPQIIDVFVPLWERSFGLRRAIYNNIEVRRKVLPYMPTLNRNRGTLKNYEFLFAQLGFTVELEVIFSEGGFDIGTFDIGKLDTFLNIQVTYNITLTCITPFPITQEIEEQVARIIHYNNPIHCIVGSVSYSNVAITLITEAEEIITTENDEMITL